MAKTVFIDYDGTFADGGRVPPAHVAAVRLVRENGHRVFLCTGRPKVSVPRALHSEFDGLVGGAGSYVEIGGRVLSDIRFPLDVAARTVAVLLEHEAVFLLEATEALTSTQASVDRIADLFGGVSSDGSPAGVEQFFGAPRVVADLSTCSFSKVTVPESPVPVAMLAESIGPPVGSLPNSVTGRGGHAGELYQRGVDKATGIAVVEARLGLRRSDIVAIGDGINDIEMLSYAGIGVAVEEAPSEVRAVADRIISGPGEEGLVAGFVDLGLIR
jgi:Cof subfamily protein (haloacid dehalogenase superfamily)